MASVIKVETLSKAYQLGEIGTGTISRDLARSWARLRGKEDPFLKIGEVNDRTSKGKNDIVWSLRDLNFEIKQGDAVGIIGRNGAGKSTLLKILSRVTAPTTGSVKVKGRIASLLEVGTGFHPELTGRENIYLNGAILGMRKSEIRRKFDEIVDFSGVERYVDTPVKRYSSGMYVRLAFAVAAHLESEIMIVDEVLAVGDAEFQKKCLGKMSDVSKGEGRTVLFVSHNMGAINNLCDSAIVLDKGMLNLQGTVNEGIKQYTQLQTLLKSNNYVASVTKPFFKNISIENTDGITKAEFEFAEDIIIGLKCLVQQIYNAASISIKLLDSMERCIFNTEKPLKEITKISEGDVSVSITIPGELLLPGSYKLAVAAHIPNVQLIETITDKLYFDVLETGSAFYQYNGADNGCVYIDCKWQTAL